VQTATTSIKVENFVLSAHKDTIKILMELVVRANKIVIFASIVKDVWRAIATRYWFLTIVRFAKKTSPLASNVR